LEKLKRGHYLVSFGIDVSRILKWILKKYDVRAWSGLDWLRTGSNGGLLKMAMAMNVWVP
jgi:hypothetical protein